MGIGQTEEEDLSLVFNCEGCGKPAKNGRFRCEKCDTIISDCCAVEYNKFTQIDYNCCKSCAKQQQNG